MARAIGPLGEWLERKPQFLAGYGGYAQYLYKNKVDTARDCPNLEETLGERLSPESFVRTLLGYQEDWDTINSMIATIQGKGRYAEKLGRHGYKCCA